MTIIQNTVYAENFPQEVGSRVFLLDSAEAESVFGIAFGQGVTSFFDFPDDHWVVKAEKRNVGRWIEAYNADTKEPVTAALQEAVNWMPGEKVYFMVSKSIVLEAPWSVFTAYWDAFLACEDDCPIVMQNLTEREALMFTALGEIRHLVG